MTTEENRQRYLDAMHAVQSGVAFLENYDGAGTEPKHLRVGVNSALINTAALVTLLIGKGVITLEEYYEVLADLAEKEVESYRDSIKAITGTEVTLR